MDLDKIMKYERMNFRVDEKKVKASIVKIIGRDLEDDEYSVGYGRDDTLSFIIIPYGWSDKEIKKCHSLLMSNEETKNGTSYYASNEMLEQIIIRLPKIEKYRFESRQLDIKNNETLKLINLKLKSIDEKIIELKKSITKNSSDIIGRDYLNNLSLGYQNVFDDSEQLNKTNNSLNENSLNENSLNENSSNETIQTTQIKKNDKLKMNESMNSDELIDKKKFNIVTPPYIGSSIYLNGDDKDLVNYSGNTTSINPKEDKMQTYFGTENNYHGGINGVSNGSDIMNEYKENDMNKDKNSNDEIKFPSMEIQKLNSPLMRNINNGQIYNVRRNKIQNDELNAKINRSDNENNNMVKDRKTNKQNIDKIASNKDKIVNKDKKKRKKSSIHNIKSNSVVNDEVSKNELNPNIKKRKLSKIKIESRFILKNSKHNLESLKKKRKISDPSNKIHSMKNKVKKKKKKRKKKEKKEKEKKKKENFNEQDKSQKQFKVKKVIIKKKEITAFINIVIMDYFEMGEKEKTSKVEKFKKIGKNLMAFLMDIDYNFDKMPIIIDNPYVYVEEIIKNGVDDVKNSVDSNLLKISKNEKRILTDVKDGILSKISYKPSNVKKIVATTRIKYIKDLKKAIFFINSKLNNSKNLIVVVKNIKYDFSTL